MTEATQELSATSSITGSTHPTDGPAGVIAQRTAPARPAGTGSRRLRLGFAGIGWIGRNRLDAIAAHAPAEVVAVADPSKKAVANVVAAFPDVRAVASFDELLADDLDGVVIATPSALHAEQAISTLESGKAVFCQKPLARTAAETAAVIGIARQCDRLLGVDLSYRFTAGMRAIRDLIRSGGVGDVHAVEAVFHNAYGPDKAWFYDPVAAGGGCLLDLGIHLVDLALWALDFPHVDGARGVVRNRERAGFSAAGVVEDYAAGVLELDTGATVQLACSWRLAAGCDARIEVSFYGTRGGATFRNVAGSFYDFSAEHFLADRSRRVLALPPDSWGGRAAISWARRLAESAAFDPEVEHLTSVALTLDRIYGR